MDLKEFFRRYADIVNVMNDEIREELHGTMCPCTELEFLKAYIKRDPQILAYIHYEHRGIEELLDKKGE